MANLCRAEDALQNAADLNKGLDALVSLMMSANESDAPPLKDLAEVIWSVQSGIGGHLDELRRCLKD